LTDDPSGRSSRLVLSSWVVTDPSGRSVVSRDEVTESTLPSSLRMRELSVIAPQFNDSVLPGKVGQVADSRTPVTVPLPSRMAVCW
jgi:hypothetical protein